MEQTKVWARGLSDAELNAAKSEWQRRYYHRRYRNDPEYRKKKLAAANKRNAEVKVALAHYRASLVKT